jgi:protein SCO1/2
MSGSETDSASRRFLHPLWALFAALVVGLPAAVMLWPERPAPERYAAIPAFSHIDQRGEPISREDLLGTVWIADFIFTRCPNICPTLSGHMQQLQGKVAGEQGIGLLSISVDPEYDTPAVLTGYAAALGADPTLWRWVTGEPAAISATVEGFQQALDVKRTPDNPVPDITHSTRLILVDARGILRGFYETDPEGLTALWDDARWLAEDPDR